MMIGRLPQQLREFRQLAKRVQCRIELAAAMVGDYKTVNAHLRRASHPGHAECP